MFIIALLEEDPRIKPLDLSETAVQKLAKESMVLKANLEKGSATLE